MEKSEFNINRNQALKSSIIGAVGLLLVGSAGFAAGHYTGLSTSKFNPNSVVAKVGKNKITQADLYSSMVSQYGKAASDSLVINKIISLESKAKGITISSSEIQNELTKVEQGYGGKSALQSSLARQGKTMAGLKKSIVSYLEMQKLVGANVHPTSSQIQSYFKQHQSTYNTPKEVRASNILVKQLSTAKTIEQKLKQGGSFSSLAKKYSIDTTTAKSGGDLGYFRKSQMVPAFADAAFSLKVNQISSPVKTKYGYNIIKVTDIQPAKTATLSSVKSEVVKALTAQQIQQDYPNWLVKQEKKYHVTDVLDPNIIKNSSPASQSQGSSGSKVSTHIGTPKSAAVSNQVQGN